MFIEILLFGLIDLVLHTFTDTLINCCRATR
jgi:hypothetical protein